MKIIRFWVIFSVFLVLVLYAWLSANYSGALNLFTMRQVSNLSAVLGIAFIFMQFVLSARIKIIERGFGLDRMLNYHRFSGRIGLVLITMHFSLIILFQWTEFGQVFFGISTLFGIIAVAGFFITAGLAAAHKALGIAYEVWKNIHLFNYILFPIALIHVFLNARQGSPLYYLWNILAVGFAAIIVYKLYSIIRMRSNPYDVVDVRQEADDIWSLFFKGEKMSYKPGQFLSIQLLRNGKLSSSHPFTISSSPTRDNISITPKELGDFTSTIKETKVGDKAFIDGSYGVFSFLEYDTDELVFIAGGSGSHRL